MDLPITDRDTAREMFNQLQARAAAQGITLRHPPSEPSTCCGRGCNGCVWESYYAAVSYWQEEASARLLGT